MKVNNLGAPSDLIIMALRRGLRDNREDKLYSNASKKGDRVDLPEDDLDEYEKMEDMLAASNPNVSQNKWDYGEEPAFDREENDARFDMMFPPFDPKDVPDQNWPDAPQQLMESTMPAGNPLGYFDPEMIQLLMQNGGPGTGNALATAQMNNPGFSEENMGPPAQAGGPMQEIIDALGGHTDGNMQMATALQNKGAARDLSPEDIMAFLTAQAQPRDDRAGPGMEEVTNAEPDAIIEGALAQKVMQMMAQAGMVEGEAGVVDDEGTYSRRAPSKNKDQSRVSDGEPPKRKKPRVNKKAKSDKGDFDVNGDGE